MEPLEQQGARPGGRPRPAGGPARDYHAGKTGQPGQGTGLGADHPQSRPTWIPAWAGQGAGQPGATPSIRY